MCLKKVQILQKNHFSEWNVKGDEDDVNVWEDNWDDDAVEDDFSVQLR